ncbi:MAG: TonB-dependent receptor, partial [Microbacterium sp.]
ASDIPLLNWNGATTEPDWSAYPNWPVGGSTKQSGLYLATRLRASDALSFIAGARWSNWESRQSSLVTGDIYDDRKERNVFTPYAAVIYDLTPQLSAYGSYTTIFNPQYNKDVNGRALDPETGKNVELGLKGEWFNGRLNASVAVFQSGKNNLAVRDGDRLTPEGDFAYRAEDDTKARGWELEVVGEPMPGWRVQGSYAQVVLKDSAGERLATDTQPKHQFKLFTTWTPASLNRLTVGGGLLWQSERYEAQDPATRHIYTIKSYAVVNLMARYAFNKHLSLAVQLNNVFDKTYRSATDLHYYGAPRNLYATLKYQF